MNRSGYWLATLALGAVAIAADAPPQPQNALRVAFPSLDTNKDGTLSLAEAQPVADLGEVFDVLDLNGDKTLSPGEFSRWKRADNGDALLSADPATGPGGSAGAQHMPRP